MTTHPKARRFPLMAKDQPCVSWNTQSSNDPKQWKQWQIDFPGCGFGYDLANSGLIVMDVDRKEGKNGEATFEALIAKHDQLPRTRTHQTPSGGWHLFFRATDKVRTYSKTANVFGEHIDNPGYVPMPGHTFPAAKNGSGAGEYVVIDNAPVADAPEWFAEYLKPREREQVDQIPLVDLDQPHSIELARNYLHCMAGAVEGQGGDDYTALTIAPHLKDLGISEDRAFELMRDEWNDRCIPPWSLDDLRTKVENGYEYCRDEAPGSRIAALDALAAEIGADEIPAAPYKPTEDDEWTKEIDDAAKDGRPSIRLVTGKEPQVRRQIKKVLIDEGKRPDCPSSDMLFRRGEGPNSLVHLSRNKLNEADYNRNDGQAPHDASGHGANELLVSVAEINWFTDRVERAAKFEKLKLVDEVDKEGKPTGKKKFVPYVVAAPQKIINGVSSIITKHDFPKLSGTSETPTLRADYSLLDKPGFDRASGLYYDPGRSKFPPIPDKPTKADALKALEWFTGPDGVLVDFSFADNDGEPEGLSLSVALALCLTPLVRRVLPTAPMIVADAFEAQSGKTELFKTAYAIATGRQLIVRSWPSDEYQRQNALLMALEAGDVMVLFDNFGPDQVLESAALDAVLTSVMYKGRRLGSSSGKDDQKVPTNVTFGGTGNHIAIGGDMKEGRTLMVRLAPKLALRDRMPDFKHRDLFAYVIQHRPQLVAAGLTILRAYAVAHDKLPPVAYRFKEWGDLVANAIEWLGMPNPIRAEDRSKDADPVVEERNVIVRAWWHAFGEEWVETNHLTNTPNVAQAIAKALAVNRLPDGSYPKLPHKAVFKYVSGMIGVNYLGLRIECRKGDSKNVTSRWRLTLVDPKAGPDIDPSLEELMGEA
jgi:hypothetical protein